jgi:hypothetical protein
MFRSVICLVAEGVIRDRTTDLISAFNIQEGLMAEGFPLFIKSLTFFALLERSADDAETDVCRFTTTLNENVLNEQPINITFQGKLKTRVLVNLVGLFLPQPGNLTFTLTLSTGVITSYTVEVNAVSSATPEIIPSPQA